jgi:NAD(P)-dependent dehydrogenase (short-subunit alcohol dehydrogenase family)
VSKLGDLDRLFAQIGREKGKLDIVFANAGVAKYSALGEITEDLYEEHFSINVKGLLFTVQKALPLLPDGAAIILTSSIVGSKGLAANSVYAATKAVARSFARTWTTDLKHRRNSRERDQSGFYRHAWPHQSVGIVTSRRGTPQNDRGRDTARPAWNTR